MVVGACLIDLHLPASHSLKDKRRVIKSILARLQNHFNVSAAEVENQDIWQSATLGLACVSTSSSHANEMLSKAVAFVETGHWEIEMTDYSIEILHV